MPGLRRDEAALLAGVGVTWYTWLEQGRDVRASPEVLSALCKALRLESAERRHLFALADRPSPEARASGPEVVEEPIRRLLESLAGQPAYVIGRRWEGGTAANLEKLLSLRERGSATSHRGK